MTLQQLRREIDRIDLQLLRLLNRRAACALRIGELKRRKGVPIFDRRREDAVVRRVSRSNRGPLSQAVVRDLFRAILRHNRWLQAGGMKSC